MPRFSDEWLIDRTMFDYVQGGSCACCAFNFLPGGTRSLITSMSELETDAVDAEVNALEILPWPPEMKDQVWMERVRIRFFCKKNFKTYKDFWKEHGPHFSEWLLSQPTANLRRWFQLPRTEILERLKSQYKFRVHAAFGTVLCAVTEQVAHFPMTGYPPDGRGTSEINFENCLLFDRRGGFTLKYLDTESTRRIWLARHESLGGPKLLERNAKPTKNSNSSSLSSSSSFEDNNSNDSDNEDENDNNDNDNNKDKVHNNTSKYPSPTPSFRSDRRIVRLLIARHFADVLQAAYLKDMVAKKAETNDDTSHDDKSNINNDHQNEEETTGTKGD